MVQVIVGVDHLLRSHPLRCTLNKKGIMNGENREYLLIRDTHTEGEKARVIEKGFK